MKTLPTLVVLALIAPGLSAHAAGPQGPSEADAYARSHGLAPERAAFGGAYLRIPFGPAAPQGRVGVKLSVVQPVADAAAPRFEADALDLGYAFGDHASVRLMGRPLSDDTLGLGEGDPDAKGKKQLKTVAIVAGVVVVAAAAVYLELLREAFRHSD